MIRFGEFYVQIFAQIVNDSVLLLSIFWKDSVLKIQGMYVKMLIGFFLKN